MTSTDKLHDRFQAVIEDANFAALDAVEATTPTPMIVYTPKDPLGSILGGDDGGVDTSQPVYHVPDGVCGFAWVNFKATSTEGRKFLNWLKGSVKSKYPVSAVQPESMHEPRSDSYYGGVTMWVGGFGQSMQRKESYGRTFARKVNEAGIEGLTAYCMSRMD